MKKNETSHITQRDVIGSDVSVLLTLFFLFFNSSSYINITHSLFCDISNISKWLKAFGGMFSFFPHGWCQT